MKNYNDWNLFQQDLLKALNRVAMYININKDLGSLTIDKIFELNEKIDQKVNSMTKDITNFVKEEIEK